MTELQQRILSIYKQIKKICDEEEIPFFAIGGTAIGAVRHHGFIPWDDDLDIAIPYPDYLRFKECAKKKLPDYLKIFDYKNTHIIRYHIKIFDSRTTFLEKNTIDYPKSYYGVFVDIMPLFGIPDDTKKYLSRLIFLKKMDGLRRSPYSSFSILKRLILAPIKLFFYLFPHSYWYDKIEKFKANYSFETSHYTGFTWGVLKEKFIFDIKFFDGFTTFPFEDTTIYCPIEYDKFLQQQFGNYMKLPEANLQKSNHYFELIDLDKSYIDYLEEKIWRKKSQ